MKTDTTKDVNPDVDEPAEELYDVSLEDYLSDTSGAARTDYVKVRFNGKPARLKIASITDEELEQIERTARKPSRTQRGQFTLDPTQFKRALAAFSLHKANPAVDMMGILDRLPKREAGDVTLIAEAVVKLSGFDEGRVAELDRLVGFTS